MSNLSYRALREQLVQAAQMLSQTGAMSHTVHGNMNVNLPSTEQMLLASKDLVIHLVPDQMTVVTFDVSAARKLFLLVH